MNAAKAARIMREMLDVLLRRLEKCVEQRDWECVEAIINDVKQVAGEP